MSDTKSSAEDVPWYDSLLKKHPVVFKELSHIECSPGWYNLLDNLAGVIEEHISNGVPDDIKEQIYAVQVKQKFAGLRFYMSHETPFITGAISMAEDHSFVTCEMCGGLGSRRKVRGWMSTLCDLDYEKEQKRTAEY